MKQKSSNWAKYGTATHPNGIENTIENARKFVSLAKSSNMSRPVLTGLAYSRNCEKAWLVASDTYRIHTCEIDPSVCPCGENETKAEQPGQYPNWERVVPKEHTRSATANAKQLETAVKACLLVAKSSAKRVRLTFGEHGMKVWATSEDDPKIEATMPLADSHNCADFTIALNGSFLLDAISAWKMSPAHLRPGVRVRFEMTVPRRPVVVRIEDTVFRAVVMPMAVD